MTAMIPNHNPDHVHARARSYLLRAWAVYNKASLSLGLPPAPPEVMAWFSGLRREQLAAVGILRRPSEVI